MRAEEQKGIAENPFVGNGEISALLRSYDWAQTPLGAIETWSESLKTAVQSRLAELTQAQEPEQVQQASVPSQNCTQTATLRQTAQADAFRVILSDALRLLTDADEIQATAARILGEHLGASRVIYAEVLQDGKNVIVQKNYTNGVAELSGQYRLDKFGRDLTDDHRAGQTAIVADVANSLRYTDSEKAMYRAIDIAAHLDVPLIKRDQFVALLAVHQATPREWTEREVKWVEETAEQTWATVERAHAEAALRESEAKYRTLFESIDEGFCTVEVLFDADGEPVDHRILQANPAFERQFGIANPEGKTASELVPGLEQYWNDLYAQVIRTGESVRTEERSDTLDRWFDILVSRVGDAAMRQVAIVFTDITDRKQAEEALRESETRLRFMLNASQIGDWDLDLTTEPYTAHRSLRHDQILGYESLLPEWSYEIFLAHVHPDDRAAVDEKFQETLSASTNWNFECRIIHPDQSPHWIWVRSSVYCDSGGTPTRLLGMVVDITDRKQAEEALREREQRLSIATEAAQLGIFEWKIAEDVTVWENDRQYELFGLTPADGSVSAQEFFENYLHPDDAPALTAKLTEALQMGILSQTSYRIRRQDGTTRWLEVNGQFEFATDGSPVRFLGVNADITDRKQAEVTILQREAQFRQLADAMPQQVWITDAGGNTQYVNQQWTTYTGLTLEQTQDIRYATQVIHPDDFKITSELWSTALATGTPYQAEFRLKHRAAQSYRWFLSRAIALRDEQGQIVQWFGTSTDIEEFRRAQAEREQLLQQEQIAREAAENTNRIKDEFLAVLSHELRSPLNPILGWTRLLRNGKLDPARQMDALATIERNAKLQAQLIEDLLDISRIMQGKLTLSATPVSLAFVIAAAVETVSLAADAKRIQITLDLDPEVAPISGDAARLQQVVWNLLTNAVKFTPNGGQVAVELRRVAAEGSLGSAMAQIRVIDTGKGINPQFLSHVFEYFRQEDASTTRKFGGLGLGLAIVRQIVELHGGTVKAESRGEHQGATFIVQLPTLQASLIDLEPAQVQGNSETRLQNVQILLVDDDTDTREFEAFLLKQQGATVIAVASGREALQALDRSLPDVIVSDIGMAEIDGYLLMQQIRSRPPTQGGTIPAIALTAYAAEIDQNKALQAGFQKHLTKPLEPEQLVSAIVTLLNSNRV